MTGLTRRRLLAGAAALATAPARAQGLMIADGAGRLVSIPPRCERIFPAGTSAAVLVYTLGPDLLLGWPRELDERQRRFLDPESAGRPVLGRLKGMDGNSPMADVVALAPDIVLDYGNTHEAARQIADQVEEATGLPYLLLDGRIEMIAGAYRSLAEFTGRRGRAATLASYADDVVGAARKSAAALPPTSVYYARGADGLETAGDESLLTEVFAFTGARNVAGSVKGTGKVSFDQIRAWNPDAVIAIDPAFAERAKVTAPWNSLPAIRAGRLHTVPAIPFGWFEPPSVTRLLGIQWLTGVLGGARPLAIGPTMRGFYELFYNAPLSDRDIETLLHARAAP